MVGWKVGLRNSGGWDDELDSYCPRIRVCAKFSRFPQNLDAYYLCIYDSNYLYVRVFQRMLVRVFQRFRNIGVRVFQRTVRY